MSLIDAISKLTPLVFSILLLVIALLAYFRRGRLKSDSFIVDLSPSRIDAEIERQDKEYEELRAKNLDSPGRRKLRALGLLP